MLRWNALYEDDPQHEKIIEELEQGEPRAALRKRFQDAKKSNEIGGREIRGMWLIDHATEQGDVIDRHGLIPGNLELRHLKWKARGKKK
ncbi:MAG: hypothetical protein IH900_03795 [Proteobacteria bacterium]|nr:hypothetical protein [Pseudomonadota bacterium]